MAAGHRPLQQVSRVSGDRGGRSCVRPSPGQAALLRPGEQEATCAWASPTRRGDRGDRYDVGTWAPSPPDRPRAPPGSASVSPLGQGKGAGTPVTAGPGAARLGTNVFRLGPRPGRAVSLPHVRHFCSRAVWTLRVPRVLGAAEAPRRPIRGPSPAQRSLSLPPQVPTPSPHIPEQTKHCAGSGKLG